MIKHDWTIFWATGVLWGDLVSFIKHESRQNGGFFLTGGGFDDDDDDDGSLQMYQGGTFINYT
jgi:hypothetical protein